jgi:hypothetical protein
MKARYIIGINKEYKLSQKDIDYINSESQIKIYYDKEKHAIVSEVFDKPYQIQRFKCHLLRIPNTEFYNNLKDNFTRIPLIKIKKKN